MFNIIERFMNKMTKEDIQNFAIKNNVILSEAELAFTYQFVKKNWKIVLSNPNAFNLERYKDKFSEENYSKMNRLLKEYMTRYQSFL